MVLAPREEGQPVSSWRLTKNNNRDKPVMTSGITSGAAISPVNNVRPRYRPMRLRARAARVPNSVAKQALTTLGLNEQAATDTIQAFRLHDTKTLDRQAAVAHDEHAFRQTSMDAAEELKQLFSDDSERGDS